MKPPIMSDPDGQTLINTFIFYLSILFLGLTIIFLLVVTTNAEELPFDNVPTEPVHKIEKSDKDKLIDSEYRRQELELLVSKYAKLLDSVNRCTK